MAKCFGPNLDLLGPNLGPRNFLLVLPLLVVRDCSKLSYAISRKTKESKNLVSGPSLVRLVQIWATIYFKKSGFINRYHGQLSSYTITKKPEDPILRKLSDRQTDGQTYKRTDGWMHGLIGRRTDGWMDGVIS